jgi:methionyl-tRNA formyltransferase
MGGALILRTLAEQPPATPQPEAGVTYAPKLSKADGALDWTRDAASLDRQVRALNPWPGTFFQAGGETLRLLEAERAAGQGAPGTVLAPGLVACGEGALRLLRLQRPGRGPMPAADLLRGYTLPPVLG